MRDLLKNKKYFDKYIKKVNIDILEFKELLGEILSGYPNALLERR